MAPAGGLGRTSARIGSRSKDAYCDRRRASRLRDRVHTCHRPEQRLEPRCLVRRRTERARRASGPGGGTVTGILVPATKTVVLVVDDINANRELLEGYLYDLGYDVRQARDGQEALEKIDIEEPDLVLLDIDMPRIDGLTVCARMKAHPVRRLVPVVLITASHDRATRLKGIEAGADDFLTKPFDAKELLIRTQVLLRDRALNKRLDAAEGVILTLARAVESRDGYTIQHAERVALYSREMGRAYGLDGEDLDVLYKSGMLHDIGKIAVPEAVLLKPGPLDARESAAMRR